jgi:hypothetical protein
MARPPRSDEPGAIHHVMIRGVEKRRIFLDDGDCGEFVDGLDRLCVELRTPCSAWALIGNHGHFVFETRDVPLAKLMARLTAPYAQRFNVRNERVGHLFQGRYKAIRVHSEGGLSRAVAYVLGNPARHGLTTIEALADYRWCAYGALVGRRDKYRFENVHSTLSALGVSAGSREEYIRAVSSAPRSEHARLEPSATVELEQLIREMCARNGVPETDVALRTARGRQLRQEIAVRAIETLGLSSGAVARALRVGKSSVWRALHRRAAG